MGATRPKPDRPIRRPGNWLVCLAIALCSIPLVGCGKKHHIFNPVVQTQPYPALMSPQGVLITLAKAYSSRDSTVYRLLFDENYQGTSLDQQDPSPQLQTYNKGDEARHIAALAKSTTISNIDIQLTPEVIRTADAGDPPGWALIQNPIFRLSISDNQDVFQIETANETIEFHFIPTPDSSSPTDTTWKIIKWVEVRR